MGVPPWKGAIRRVSTYSFLIFLRESIDLKLFHAFGRIFVLLAAYFLLTGLIKKNIDLKCFHAVGRIFLSAGYLKSIDLKLFQSFGLPFCWLPFPWSFYYLRSTRAKNLKFRMRPIRFKNCNFCSIYLLNNKNLECGYTSMKRCYTQGFCIFFFNISWKKYWFEDFSCFWSNLCFAGCFFNKKFNKKSTDLKCFHVFGRIFLFAGYLKSIDLKFFQAFGLPFLLAAFSLKFLIFEVKIQNLECGPLDLKIACFVIFTC